MAGPVSSGKTALSNYIADLSETFNASDYRPTQGVRYHHNTHAFEAIQALISYQYVIISRILEFERKLVSDGKKHKWKEANVEGTISNIHKRMNSIPKKGCIVIIDWIIKFNYGIAVATRGNVFVI